MNGVDAVLVATGQGLALRSRRARHAWPPCTGRYALLATWREQGDAPTSWRCRSRLAIAGGALLAHPSARLRSSRASRMPIVPAALVAAAGLADQPRRALRALATEGIQRGHMALHARGVVRAAVLVVSVERVAAEIAACGDVKLDRAREDFARLHVKESP